jgi:ribulose-5-phosphate 4-epimerase/fuculose-1-phosphate aldolase
MSMSEAQVRRDLATAYNLIAHFRMDDLIHTHASARLPDEPELLLINRYGDLFEEITPESLVTIDRSVGEAFSLMYQLEKACRIQLAVLASGAAITLPDEAVRAKTAAQYNDDPDDASDLEWRALLRLAERVNANRPA